MGERKKAAAVLAALLLVGCGGTNTPVETADPYEGMVRVESGFGTKMWVTKLEGVPVNPLTAGDFGDGMEYTGSAFTAKRGVDVSEHQGRIDWAAAAADGIEFAILRAGYRGYGESGTMRRDLYFQENMKGATDNGLDVGVYFFSQATTAEEARDEAAFLLNLLEDYSKESVTMPVYYDWEDIGIEAARTDGIRGDVLTDCALVFCEVIRQAGYRPGIYAYRNLGYFSYDLSRFQDCSLWIGSTGSYPDFYYAHELWQYDAAGSVAGVEGPVDMDLWFIPREEE